MSRPKYAKARKILGKPPGEGGFFPARPLLRGPGPRQPGLDLPVGLDHRSAPEGQARQDQLALRGGTSIPAMLGYFVACLLLSGGLLLLGLDPTAVSALFAM